MTINRVVLDTNVLVSGLVFGGTPSEVLDLVIDGLAVRCTSPALEQELEGVLHVKFADSYDAVREVLTILRDISISVTPRTSVAVITRDPTDNRVLECALDGQADAVVSGDKHLLSLKTFRRISILTPQEFLTRFHQ